MCGYVSCREVIYRPFIPASSVDNYPVPTHKLQLSQGTWYFEFGSVRARIHSVIIGCNIFHLSKGLQFAINSGLKIKETRIGVVRQMGSTGFGFRGEISIPRSPLHPLPTSRWTKLLFKANVPQNCHFHMALLSRGYMTNLVFERDNMKCNLS